MSELSPHEAPIAGMVDDEGGESITETGARAHGPSAPATSSRRRAAARATGAASATATVAAPATGEISWDIEVEPYAEHELVERYLGIFGGRARSYTESRLERGTRYESLIRSRLREADMPEDLYYLAFVESGFDAHAYSRAAAVGMWQFMTTTARAVGLRVDWWVDDRRDPVRSTDAAVRHLADLRRQFDGSAYLAAAAYNGGSGRVSRALGQNASDVDDAEGEDRFFALAEAGGLRDETRNYVPQLIAVAMIAKEPERYGITVDPLPPLAYDSVMVPAATPLAAVALASGASLDDVKELNGRFLRGMTPPEGRQWEVRVPAGLGAGFTERFAELPDSVRDGVERVEAKKGETLASVAREHGLTERQLGWYNPGVNVDGKGKLRSSAMLLVPSLAVVEAALDVADPAAERYSDAPKKKAAPQTYTVRSGDSLDRIARRHGLTVKALKSLNGLEGDLIRPGQKLVVSR
ncbi:MAG TPA: transglycosylase SLT domain-containing protein [Gemmatimonadales bacterium]